MKKHVYQHKTDMHQIGKSVREIDIKKQAYKPGRRKSKKGNTYYERRMNRSDKHKNL